MNIKYYKDTVESLHLHYNVDDSVVVNNNCFDVAENVKFNTSDILQNCNDVKLNNYNCLCLTNTQSLTTNTTQPTTLQNNFSFITYLKDVETGKYLSLLQTGNGIQSQDTDVLDDAAIFQCICQVETLYIQKYDDVSQKTYYVDVFNDENKIVNKIKSYSYIIDNDIIQLYDINTSHKHSYQIQSIPTNINYTNATSRYNNISGGILSSIENHNNNYIIDTQYSICTGDTLSCNILTLDNQYSYTNNLLPATNWNTTNLHTVKTLQTGTWQEHGNSHIYDVKEFYTCDIKIAPGYNTFTTPKTLYPFEVIDINDTTFVKCGAVGGVNPAVADRIYVDRYPQVDDNKILLCTWLSANDVDAIWVDRYYNPTLINQEEALKSNADKIIFDTLENNPKLLTRGYFDKQSDLAIKPNQKLTYYHISQQDFQSYIDQYHPTQVNDIKCYNVDGVHLYTTNKAALTGNTYITQNISTLVNNNFALSFNMNVFDWIDSQYYELFTSQSNNCGIRIYKNIPITPVLMIYKTDDTTSTTTIRSLNTDFRIIDEFSIEGIALNIFRPNNLEYIVIQFKDKVCVYNIFGTQLHVFNGDIYNCYYTTPYIYIIYNDNISLIHKYDVYTFEEVSTSTIENDVEDADMCIYENDTLWLNNNEYKPQNYAYVDNYGLFTLYLSGMGDETVADDLPDDLKSDIPVSSDGRNGTIMLNTGSETVNTVTKSDTKYFAVHSDEFTDTFKSVHFNHHDICDFAIYQDTIYFVTPTRLFISDLDRTTTTNFILPIHSSGTNYKTNIVVACELVDEKFKPQVYVLISNESQDTVEVYKFSDDNFTLLNTLNLVGFTLHQMTGKTYIPKFDNKLLIDLQFKINDNKIVKYTSPIKDIAPGKHTLLINMDNTTHECKLFVDDVLNTSIPLDETYIIHYNMLQNNIMFGNTLLYNGANLATYTHKSTYLLTDVTVNNIIVFNTPIDENTVKINTLLNNTTPTLTLNLPCGQRCTVSKINNIYKHSIPGYKSTNFDIIVKNLKLSDKNQTILSKLIKQYIQKYTPVITNLDDIVYKNY